MLRVVRITLAAATACSGEEISRDAAEGREGREV